MSGPTLPASLAGLFDRLGVAAAACRRTDGRWSVHYDGGRVDLYLLPGPRWVLETLLGDLPVTSTEREYMLDMAGRVAAGRLKAHADTLSISEGGSLVLQHEVSDARQAAELETELADFLDSAEQWRRLLALN